MSEAPHAPVAIDPSLRIGSVTLAVAELARSVEFYEQVLGLPLLAREPEGARFGFDAERPALVLRAIADPVAVAPCSTGLFHVAWLHPSRAELAASVERIVQARWPITGAADHGVSEALYLNDPDGLGIEIYADRPRERWDRPPGGRGVRMVTLPLDVENLLAQGPVEPAPAMAGVSIGHIHLKVADVRRAADFYARLLGFELQAQLDAAAFLSAGGYHHHVGLNSWQSRGGSAPSEHAPGLRLVEFELGETGALEALERRLAEAAGPAAGPQLHSGRVDVSDPDGNRLAFVALVAVAG